MTPERRPMTDEEFERLLAARVRAEKAAANSPEAVKARRLDAARKRVFERQADVMSRTQALPAGGQALAQVGALMIGDPTTLPLRALAARDQMGEAASAIGRGAMDAGKSIGSKAQGLASALAADPQGAARAAFVAPAQAVMTGARLGAGAIQAAPQAAQAVATDAQSIGRRVQGLQAPNVSREQLAAAVRATPRVLGDVAAGMSGALNMQRGFDEGVVQSEARGMAGDYRGANLATMRAAGEFAMGGSSALGVGAMAAPALKGVARGGAALGARLAKKPPVAAAPPAAATALPKTALPAALPPTPPPLAPTEVPKVTARGFVAKNRFGTDFEVLEVADAKTARAQAQSMLREQLRDTRGLDPTERARLAPVVRFGEVDGKFYLWRGNVGLHDDVQRALGGPDFGRDGLITLRENSLEEAFGAAGVGRAEAPISTARAGYDTPLPKGEPAWHSSGRDWAAGDNPAIDVSAGEGFGFHVGTKRAALERYSRDGAVLGDPPTLIDVVTEPGRAINLKDIGDWSDPALWRAELLKEQKRLGRGAGSSGLARTELEELIALTYSGERLPKKDFATAMRERLRGFGVDAVRYKNRTEDSGSVSAALLSPEKVRWASKAKFDPAKKGQSGLLLGTGLGIGGLALTAPDALSQTRQQVEDQIVQADGRAPIRPDGWRAMRAGFMQGMSLDWSDEIARALAGKTPEERALLQERIAIAREQGATPEELAQLMQAEYEADRVSWEAGASPSEFKTGRMAGEVATGLGVAALAAGAGNRFGGPFWNNLAVGGLKGLAYGAGSGTGEVPLEERGANAVASGVISGTISGLAVPGVQSLARRADNAPIAYQNWANKQRAAKWAKANPNPEDGVQFQPKTDARRFTAKPTSELVSDIPAEEAVQLARMADAARAGQKDYVPIGPRLEALVRGNRAGADAMRAAAAPVAKPPRQTTPRAKPEPSQGDALAADLALYGELRLRADRGEATPADLREMAKVKKRVEMPKQPRQPAAKTAKPSPMPMLPPLPPGLAGPEVLKSKNQKRDFVVPRMDDASAAALGGALVKPSTGVNPRVPSDPLSPQQINLQKMVVRGKERGMTPKPRKSQYTSRADNALKGLATAFAIPMTGGVQDGWAKVTEWADGRSEYAREYDAAKQGETKKPPPLGAERTLRGDVSAKTLAAIQADLAKQIADAEPTARAAALKDVAKAENEVALLRAAMTPTYRRVTRPDGESVRVRTQAYRDALKAAETAGLKPSAEALKAARERLKAVSGETFVADRVAAELADLRRQQRDAEAKAAALQRR